MQPVQCLRNGIPNYLSQSAPEEEPPAYTSPNATYDTPAVGLTSKGASDTSPIPPPDFSDKPKRELRTPQTTEASATSSKLATSPSSTDLKSQLADAHSQIQRLKDRLADQGLRQRKIPGETEKSTGSALQQQSPQSVEAGVSVQIVAGLCLLSFLIAYFLF